MHKYRSAMDKLTPSPELESRLLARMREETGAAPFVPYPKRRLRPLLAAAACLVLAVSLAVPFLREGENPQNLLTGNPVLETQEISALEEALAFSLLVPTLLPEGYEVEGARVIAGSIAEITFTDGAGTICYRQAQGREDISGDYTAYEEVKTLARAGMEIILKETGGRVFLATWTAGGESFSLSFSQGVEEEMALLVTESLKAP